LSPNLYVLSSRGPNATTNLSCLTDVSFSINKLATVNLFLRAVSTLKVTVLPGQGVANKEVYPANGLARGSIAFWHRFVIGVFQY
jgi:hypothetical protein